MNEKLENFKVKFAEEIAASEATIHELPYLIKVARENKKYWFLIEPEHDELLFDLLTEKTPKNAAIYKALPPEKLTLLRKYLRFFFHAIDALDK